MPGKKDRSVSQDATAASFLPAELLGGQKKKKGKQPPQRHHQEKAKKVDDAAAREDSQRKADAAAAALAAKVASEAKPKEAVGAELADELKKLVISPEVVNGPVVGDHAGEAAQHGAAHCGCCCGHDHGHDHEGEDEHEHGHGHDSEGAEGAEDERHRTHAFWSKQPVVMPGRRVGAAFNNPIHADLRPEDVPKAAVPLPAGYAWVCVDVTDAAQLQEVFQLLEDNYVEDDDNMFRFDYAPEFLRWALLVPGRVAEWVVGIRRTAAPLAGAPAPGQLVGLITGVPLTMRLHDRVVRMAEINFLCVHKQLRALKLAPMLIQEVTRQVHLAGLFQAVYTAGVTLPTPFTEARYYHRSLNPKKLVEVGFSGLSRNMTVARAVKLYRVPERTALAGLRPMEPRDVPAVHRLLTEYLARFDVAPVFAEDEVAHLFLPRKGVMSAYVVEDPATHALTALGSFYSLPSSVLTNPKYKRLSAAYLYYCVNTRGPVAAVVSDLLVLAKQMNYDVFNCLDLMDNGSFLKDLKFGPGDGTLHYYIYNWAMPQIPSNKLGLVLV